MGQIHKNCIFMPI